MWEILRGKWVASEEIPCQIGPSTALTYDVQNSKYDKLVPVEPSSSVKLIFTFVRRPSFTSVFVGNIRRLGIRLQMNHLSPECSGYAPLPKCSFAMYNRIFLYMTFCSSSIISKKASLARSTLMRPNPTNTVRFSSGFLVEIVLAICDEYRCPMVSRCSPPPPIMVFGVR